MRKSAMTVAAVVLFGLLAPFASSGQPIGESRLEIEDLQCRGNVATSCDFILGYGYRARLEQFRFRWQKDGTFEFKDDRNRHAFDVVYGWNSEDDRERMEMIRKWVAENSITPADIAGPNSGGGLAVTIFNRIFEQYARGADIAALWQETSTSGPFRLEELAGENR